MLYVGRGIEIPDAEIELSAVRAQGAGGQNVNKVASAIHLRFDVHASGALPDDVKARLLALPDRRISGNGVIIIKAQRFRSQEKNREEARARLAELLKKGLSRPKKRIPTKPTRQARERRLEEKAHRARLKRKRGPVGED